jgi:hypothetical protein
MNLTLQQLDAILDRLYKKEKLTEKDKENIRYYEEMYQQIAEEE